MRQREKQWWSGGGGGGGGGGGVGGEEGGIGILPCCMVGCEEGGRLAFNKWLAFHSGNCGAFVWPEH